MKKKVLGLLLTVITVVALFALFTVTASAASIEYTFAYDGSEVSGDTSVTLLPGAKIKLVRNTEEAFDYRINGCWYSLLLDDSYTYTVVYNTCKVFIEGDEVHIVDLPITVNYDLNGGSGICPINMANYGPGDNINLASTTGITKDNYVIKGWALSSGATTALESPYTVNVNHATVSEDETAFTITFYAVWQPCYSITYETNDGSSVEPLSESTEIVFPNTNPTKDGYTFGGWYLDLDCTQEAVAGTTLTDDIILYAKFPVATIGETTYQNLYAALNAAGTNKTTIKLIGNVIETITIDAGADITLDLNGYVLNCADAYRSTFCTSTSTIINNGTLTLTDSRPTVQHHFSDNSGLWKWDSTEEATAHVISGGCITGGNGAISGTDKNTTYGGGICNNGTFVMLGGNIVGNKATYGGGIYNNNSKTSFVFGGTITGNSATNGGGIYLSKTAITPTRAGCFIEGTKITMPDGTTKKIEEICVGDFVRTFNHETGEYESRKVLIAYKSEQPASYFTLHFDNGTELSIAVGHNLFEKSACRYVTVSEENYTSFIGHEFYSAADEDWVKLVSVTASTDEKYVYSLYVAKTIDCIAGGMLSAPDDVAVLDIFSYNDDLTVDSDALAEDIETYGLLSYEDFPYSCSRQRFDDINGRFVNILLGKGLATREEMNEAFNEWYAESPAPKLTKLKKVKLLGAILEPSALTVGGTANVTGNVGGNVYVSSGKLIAVDTSEQYKPKSTMSIGITLEGTTGAFSQNNASAANAKYFTSDNANYIVSTALSSSEYRYSIGNIISEEPSKDNDYKVTVDDSLTNDVTYQWYKSTAAWKDATEADLYFINIGNNAYTPTTNSVNACTNSAFRVSSSAVAVRFKYSGTGTVNDCTFGADGYYHPSYDKTNDYYAVSITDKGEDDCFTDIEAYVITETALTGETNAKLGTTALENASYFCKISKNSTVIATSKSVTPFAISYKNLNGATGTKPATTYQLENRKVTLPENPFTADSATFTGWSDGENSYNAGSEYTVTGDVNFTAVLTHSCHNLVFDKILTWDILVYNGTQDYYELDGGNYYLTGDLDFIGRINLMGDCRICLNGYVMNLNDYQITSGIPDIYLCDCKADDAHTHYFKVDENDGTWALSDDTDYDKTVKGGVITGSYGIAVSAPTVIAEDVNFIGNGKVPSDNQGGAIHAATISLRRCNVIANHGGMGGAIYCTGELSLYDTVLEYNTAVNGGAIYAEGKARLDGCTVRYNKADEKGGAVLLDTLNASSILTVIDTVISDNEAGVHGGGIAFDEAGCLVKGTKITMADDTEKNVEDVKVGDLVKSFNHETGVFENGKVCYVYKGENPADYFTLHFTSGKTLDVFGCHDLFSKKDNKYVTIHPFNYTDYVGTDFYNGKDGTWETLESVTYSTENAEYYSIYVSGTQNCLANGMLTVPDDVDFVLNVYEFDYVTLKADADALAQDIQNYGLFTREECKLAVSEAEFANINLQYKNLYIGKNLITAFDLDGLFYELHNVDEFLEGVEGPALVLGKNAVIKNNTADGKTSNVYLDFEAMIYVVDGASGIECGVELSDTVGTFAKDVYTNDASKVKFTSDVKGLSQHKTGAGTPTTYTYSLSYIKEQPTKDNNYTVSVDSELENVTYQWNVYKTFKMTDLIPMQNQYATGDYDAESLSGSYELNVGFALKYFRDGGYLKYKGNGYFYGEPDDDGYYMHALSSSNIIDNYFYVLVEGDDELQITDFILVWDVAVDGETDATFNKTGATTLENVEYYCNISVDGTEVAKTNKVKAKEISFAGGTDAVGTNPNTVYQLEGRTITLPENPYTQTGYKFDKWGTTKAGESYTVGATDVTLTATWIEKANLTVDMSEQESEKGNNLSPFTVKCEEEVTGFTVYYRKYTAQTWSTTAPTDIGVYQVRVQRDEDDTYKEYDSDAATYKIYYVITFDNAGATSGTAPNPYKSTVGLADFNPDTSIVLTQNTLVKEGFVQDGWLVKNQGALEKWGTRGANSSVVLYPCWKPVVNTLEKTNDFGVTLSGTDVSYQWYEYKAVKFEDVEEENYYLECGTYDVQTKTITSAYVGNGLNFIAIQLDPEFATLSSYLTCKFACDDECDYYDYDENYVTCDASTLYRLNVIDIGGVLYLFVNSFSEFTASDLILYVPKALSGETGKKVTTVSDADVACKVSYLNRIGELTFETSTFTNAVTPVAVSFAGGTGATGTDPETMYQLEGRTITLPENPYTKTGYKFDKWGTTKAGESYTVGATDVTLTATWTDKTPVSITETAQNVTYSGSAQNFALLGTHKDIGSFTVKYYVGGEWTTQAPTNVGTYDVKISRAEDANYSAYEKTVDDGLVIGKADITVTPPTAKTLTYNGTDLALVNAGSASFGTLQYKLADGTYSTVIPVAKNAGTYTVYYKVAGDENHNDATEATVSVTIDKLAVNEPTVTGNYTYTGAEQTATRSGVETYMTESGSVKGTNAGEYTITYSLDDNHKWADGSDGTVTWSIAKAQAVMTVDQTPIVKTFGEAVTLPTATSNFGTAVCDKTVSDLVNANTYTVTYSIAATDNYDGDTKTVSVTIDKLAVNEPTVTGNYTYTGTEKTATFSGVESFMTESGTKATEVGVYQATFTLDDNHKWADGSDGIVTWEIKAVKISPKDEGAPADKKQDVIVSTDEGFASDIEVVVEVTVETSVEAEIKNNNTIVDYYNIQTDEEKLQRNEKIGVVFDVKLIRTVDGVSTEIQPSDIAPGTRIRVKMLIPEGVNVSKVTRILHVHSANDIESISFNPELVDADGYYEIEIDRLSEFAFVYEYDFTHYIALALLIALLGFVGVLWFALKIRTFKKDGKLAMAPVVGFAVHFVALITVALFAFCTLCWILVGANAIALILFVLLYLRKERKKTTSQKGKEAVATQMTLKTAIDLSANAPCAVTGISKKTIAEYLKNTFGKTVDVNCRQNYINSGVLPLADTHFKVFQGGKKCFAYVYEQKGGQVFLLVRANETTAKRIAESHPAFTRSAFPHTTKNDWYTLLIDDSFTTNIEVFDVLSLVFENFDNA